MLYLTVTSESGLFSRYVWMFFGTGLLVGELAGHTARRVGGAQQSVEAH